MNPPNIVLVVADCLRPDLPVLGYPRDTTPRLDSFLRGARGFTRCWSVCGWTLPACASIVTGQPPSVHGLTDHDGSFAHPKLGHWLPPDYLRQGIGNNGNLVPDDIDEAYLKRLGAERNGKWRRFGWNDGFDRYDWFHRLDHDGPFARAEAFLREQAGADRPHFLFLHTNLAHDYSLDRPYYRSVPEWFDGELPPQLHGFADGPGAWRALRETFDDAYLAHQIKARYDCGVLELDRRLAALFQHIDFERTIVVLASDHGEGFRPDLARVHHCGRLHEDLLRVPLFLWAPQRFGLRVGLDPRVCSTLDIVPTLLQVLGLDPGGLPGHALLEPPKAQHRPLQCEDRAYAYWPGELQRRSYETCRIGIDAELTWPLKTVRLRMDEREIAHCYNLANDPEETRDLLALPPARLPSLSIVVVVNDWAEFRQHADASPLYRGGRHQWILLDNCGNRLAQDICRLYAQGAVQAEGELLVFAHQDVLFPPGWEQDLESALAQLASLDPHWGVIGSVGIALDPLDPAGRRFVGHWCDPGGHRRQGPFPARVQSLDEQWLCIRRASGLRFDEALPGFHCYGVDLCMQAQAMGLSCYAIDAFVWHKFRGPDGRLPLAPRESDKIMRRATAEFVSDAQRGYQYVGRKWSSRMPFHSTSMSWTDPQDLVYRGPRWAQADARTQPLPAAPA